MRSQLSLILFGMLIGLSGRDGRKNGTKTKNEKGTRNEMKRTNERTSRLKDGVERSFILKRGGLVSV